MPSTDKDPIPATTIGYQENADMLSESDHVVDKPDKPD